MRSERFGLILDLRTSFPLQLVEAQIARVRWRKRIPPQRNPLPIDIRAHPQICEYRSQIPDPGTQQRIPEGEFKLSEPPVGAIVAAVRVRRGLSNSSHVGQADGDAAADQALEAAGAVD